VKLCLSLLISFFVGSAALAVMAQPAAARPRDDVMSGAFRCAAIGDQRTWLDCYYGAAQPARAALSMSPAPAAQARLAASPPAGSAALADLSVRDQVMSGAFRCGSFADERQWLNCYYGAAAPVRAQLGLSPATQAPPPVPVPSGNPAAAGFRAPTQFGMVPKPAPEIPENVKQINARMASYSFDKLGWFTVTLDDGQVWYQIHGDTDYARWNKSASLYQVRISHGFLGSYNLQVKGQPGLFKVLRQK
jgi:hypothetical protein